MSERHLEQWINIKFGMKIGKSASEMLILFKWLLVNMLLRNWVFLNGSGSSRKSVKMCTLMQEVGSQKQ